MPKHNRPTLADSATIARAAALWVRGKRKTALEAVVFSADTRSAATLAMEVYARLRDYHGLNLAEAFRRQLRR